VEPIVATSATPNKKRKLEEDSGMLEEAGEVGGAEEGGITVLYIGGLDISFTSRHLPPLLEVY
jgi:hypothetical protein